MVSLQGDQPDGHSTQQCSRRFVHPAQADGGKDKEENGSGDEKRGTELTLSSLGEQPPSVPNKDHRPQNGQAVQAILLHVPPPHSSNR
jgi:hypothetical protein